MTVMFLGVKAVATIANFMARLLWVHVLVWPLSGFLSFFGFLFRKCCRGSRAVCGWTSYCRVQSPGPAPSPHIDCTPQGSAGAPGCHRRMAISLCYGRLFPLRWRVVWWASVLLWQPRLCGGKCDELSKSQGDCLHHNAECQGPCLIHDDPMWSAPQTIAGDLAVGWDGDFYVVPRHPHGRCHVTEVPGRVFLIEDVASLGHMQMSFAALFSFLVAQPVGAHVAVAWERSADEFVRIRAAYYEPLLRLFQAHFAERGRLALRTLPSEPGLCYRSGNVTVRSCVAGPLGDGLGHCAAWFASARVVARWRQFLTQGLPLPRGLYAPEHSLCRSPAGHRWRVLVYNRAHGLARSLDAPYTVIADVARHLRRRLGPGRAAVDFHQERSGRRNATDFAANCALFGRYDVLVLVHGAAMSNLVCARPCARVLELGFGKYNMFRPLVQQLGLVHCLAPVHFPNENWLADAGDLMPRDRVVMPRDLWPCLDALVALPGVRAGAGVEGRRRPAESPPPAGNRTTDAGQAVLPRLPGQPDPRGSAGGAIGGAQSEGPHNRRRQTGWAGRAGEGGPGVEGGERPRGRAATPEQDGTHAYEPFPRVP